MSNLARRGVNASIGLASDAMRGRNMSNALKHRVGEVLSSTLIESKKTVKKPTQSNSKKRKNMKKSNSKAKSKRPRKSTPVKDIFS